MFVEGYEIGETKEIVFVSKNIDDYIRKGIHDQCTAQITFLLGVGVF